MNHNQLDVKEMRFNTIQSYLDKGYDYVVVIKANIPGQHKHRSESYMIVHVGENILKTMLSDITCIRHEGEDGPWTLALLKMDMIHLKHKLIEIENNHALGRLLDLDIYDQSLEPISRTALGYPKRACFLCDKDAHLCVREKTHPFEELDAYIKKTIHAYLVDTLSYFIKESMMKELNLDHKFGLVTPSTSGSHVDMNYELMVKTQQIIIPYLTDIFFVGYSDIERYRLLTEARKIGINAEWAMFEKTNGVNCYKGLIFILGLVLVSLGYTLYHHQTFEHIFHNIQLISKPLLDDFMDKPITFGEHAYQEHRIMGARGEAYLGLPSVHHALSFLEHKELTDTELRKSLQLIIRSTDDTVLLKRAKSFENYLEAKKRIENVNMDHLDDVKSFTKWAIENRLSFGGSADLLIATLFLYYIKPIFF